MDNGDSPVRADWNLKTPLPSETPLNVANASNNFREADNRLLDMLNNQLLTVARESARVIFVLSLLCIFTVATTAWVTWRLNRVEDTLVEVLKTNEQAKKQIWELKNSLGLKFSQEKSKRGKSEAEMPEL